MKTLIYILSFVVIGYSISLFIYGKKVNYRLPKNMKSKLTYHSRLSDKSYDNWLFAQRIFGLICIKSSYYLIPINILLSLIFFLFMHNENVVVLLFLSLLIIDVISLKINKFKTEKCLKKECGRN